MAILREMRNLFGNSGAIIALLGALWVVPYSMDTAWSGESQSRGPVSTSVFGKVPIGGYDTVAYHSSDAISTHTAMEGNKSWVFSWRGAKWRFASKDNYEAFRANPDKYRPAYGGFCSNALSLGEGLIKTDGSQWEIFGDTLHTFYAPRGRDRWLDGNQASYKVEADRAWKEITGFDD